MSITFKILWLIMALTVASYAVYVIVAGFINASKHNKKAKKQKHRKLISQLKTVN